MGGIFISYRRDDSGPYAGRPQKGVRFSYSMSDGRAIAVANL